MVENWCFSAAFNDMEYIFQVGNRWSGLFVTYNLVLFQENSREIIGLSQKKLQIFPNLF